MSDWIQVDIDPEQTEQHQSIQGVEVNVLVSPYDIPEAVRGDYDKDKQRFIIEFKYMGDEPKKVREAETHLYLAVGKHSGRLYRIEIDVDALQVNSVSCRVGVERKLEIALEHLVDAPLNPVRRENYRLAKDTVSSKKNELFLALAS